MNRHHADRFAQIGAVASSVRAVLQQALLPLAILLASGTLVLWLGGTHGAACFGLVSLGTIVVLGVWNGAGVGLPVVPLLAIQNLLLYAMPLVTKNETVLAYPDALITDAGFEILVFSITLAAAWRFGIATFRFGSPLCYALQGFSDEKMTKLANLGFRLAFAATAYTLLEILGLLRPVIEMLPAGSGSIVTAVVAGCTACGFFLSAMVVGKGAVSPFRRTMFWGMLAFNAVILAAGFLLSTTTTLLLSVATGLFWSTGRIPWRFLITAAAILGFFNIGKFEMRNRYWNEDDNFSADVTVTNLPTYYRQWATASFDIIIGEDPAAELGPANLRTAPDNEQSQDGQSLFDRMNNLQNIAFVMNAVRNRSATLLEGATYAIIPPLLIPRILWPDKPRTHEGQVLLNVHFGRQDYQATFRTYVAWGLQAEAYGNFGPLLGNALLGTVMGLIFAWVEKFGARKLLLSMEGFLSFVLFLGMANSFEMVSSVLVTSIFQAFVPVALATWPFVERVLPKPAPS